MDDFDADLGEVAAGKPKLAHLPDRYRSSVQALVAAARCGGETGLPPERVATVVVRAATAERLRARYALPTRERVLARLVPLLPERLTDA